MVDPFRALETSLVGRAAGLRWALASSLSLPLGGLIAYRYLVGTDACATSSGSARSS